MAANGHGSAAAETVFPPEPGPTCPLCPRLAAFLETAATADPDGFNRPVPSFGDANAELLIVGLAPGLKGANRTGRPFTGDYAGDLLYATLARFGWSTGTYDGHRDDGLSLHNCMITNAVRCVPPANKPTGQEIRTCNGFLKARIAALPRLRVLLALGRIAHDAALGAFNLRKSAHKFGHGAQHTLDSHLVLVDSFHCSRYNTNTGRLTEAMFHSVFKTIATKLDTPAP